MGERPSIQPVREDREQRSAGLAARVARRPLARLGLSLALIAGPVACGSSAQNAGREAAISVPSIPGLTTTTIGRVEAIQPEVTTTLPQFVYTAPAPDTVTGDTIPASSPDIDSLHTSPTTATTLFSKADRGPVTTIADVQPVPATTPTTQPAEPEVVQPAPTVITAPVSQAPGSVLVGGVEESVPVKFTPAGGCGPVGKPVCISSVEGYLREGPDGYPAARNCDPGGRPVALHCEATEVFPVPAPSAVTQSNPVGPSWHQ